MDFFSHDRRSVIHPREMVTAFAQRKGLKSDDLALESLALITFTLPDLKRLTEIDRRATEIEAWRTRNLRVFRGDGWIAARSPYGAPNAVMLLEEFIAFGVKRVIYLGYCGSLQEGIPVGDVVIPTEAIREEGTSYHYLPEGEKSLPDRFVQDRLFDWVSETSSAPHKGKVWTTDAPYREAPKKIVQYREEGVLAVEMEMSAVFAVAEVRRISVGSILLVSDEVRETEWKIGFFSSTLKETRERAIEGLLVHLKEMIP